MRDALTTEVSHHVWQTKYRYRTGAVIHDRTLDDTWRRVARAVVAVELLSTATGTCKAHSSARFPKTSRRGSRPMAFATVT